ncbi:hypothetical protein HOY80DRAFT_948195 [Tuber brumale]|nr:hypothetical protein HOY80DRAFT_948195 [Tuber brumale]
MDMRRICPRRILIQLGLRCLFPQSSTSEGEEEKGTEAYMSTKRCTHMAPSYNSSIKITAGHTHPTASTTREPSPRERLERICL